MTRLCACVAWMLLLGAGAVPLPGHAQEAALLTGAVLDPLGERVAGATVTLVGGQPRPVEVRTDADGVYTFQNIAAGRYQVVVTAPGFEAATSSPIFVGVGERVTSDVTLQIGTIQQAVLVTASAAEVSQAQTGAPVTVIDEDTLDALNKTEVSEALRLVPGSHVVPTGGRGGTTAMFIRGGNANFNKVLVDGIPVNDIGGAFDFAQMSTGGVERLEVLRQTNSVIYGSDALAGVINITTKRGRSRIPELEYSLDGGNLGTLATTLSFGGVARRLDYFSSYSRLQTDNDVPNNAYENGTFAGRFGVALAANTDVSVSVRRIDSEYESSNAILNFGIADDSSQDKQQTYVAASARSQWTDRLQSTLRFGWTDEESLFVNPSPTGTPFDPFGFGPNYLGNEVTITGANGFSVKGRGILDFGGQYPSTFDTRTDRRLIAGDTTFDLNPTFAISAGARFEHERGYDDPDAEPTASRSNGGMFVEGRGSFMNRHYVSAGVGYERNEVFESAVTPRVSVASYLRLPSAEPISDTKIVLNAGTGIKAPSVFQQQNSLLALVEGTPVAATVSPVGPERSKSFDIGVEQGLWGGDARLRASYFHNTFDDLLEFLGRQQLVLAGVPPEVAAATAFGGYLNAASYKAQGIEMSGEAALRQAVRFGASYTYLDAEVTRAFSASASVNPAFPGVEIGQFSPLVGERPFRRPRHSGTLFVSYMQGPAQVTLSGFFSGKRDDSTFLSDPFFGTSMLLPNQDLAPAYQKFDVSAAYQVHRRVRGYLVIDNLFDQDYQPSFGFPGLPLTARAGVRITFGGDARTPNP
jgi:vitamin B12 transporter